MRGGADNVYLGRKNVQNEITWSSSLGCVLKGQLISKGLFAILEFLQRTNETIQS